jgi:hypothetical protein
MATYNNLPVFKTSYTLLLILFGVTRNMNKDIRYSLGERLKNEMLELVVTIYRANCRVEKKALLLQAREHIELVRMLLRLSFDLKQFPVSQFAIASEQVDSISKQLTSWEKSCKA